MADLTSAVAGVIESELRFLDPAVNSSPALLGELLHPEFVAFGSSGRKWDRDSLVAEMRERSPSRPLTASDLKGVELAPGVVHVTFEADSNGLRTHRSSVWLLTAEGWRLYFHQGTAVRETDLSDESAGARNGADRSDASRASSG